MQGLQSTKALIDNGVDPVALNVAVAFWQASRETRSLFVFFSLATVSLLSATAFGAAGLFDRR